MAIHRLRIVGVHYAVNPESTSREAETEQMHQRTAERLRQLDEQRPRVVLMPEPSNPVDSYAVMARVAGKRIGYVEKSQLDLVHALLKAKGGQPLLAQIDEVEAKKHGWLYVTLDATDGLPVEPQNRPQTDWSGWESAYPVLAPDDAQFACMEAEAVLEELLLTLPSDSFSEDTSVISSETTPDSFSEDTPVMSSETTPDSFSEDTLVMSFRTEQSEVKNLNASTNAFQILPPFGRLNDKNNDFQKDKNNGRLNDKNNDFQKDKNNGRLNDKNNDFQKDKNNGRLNDKNNDFQKDKNNGRLNDKNNGEETIPDIDLIEEYIRLWLKNSLHDLSAEARLTREHYISVLKQGPDDPRIQALTDALEKQRTAICGGKRMKLRIEVWWKQLLESPQMQLLWDSWVASHGGDLEATMNESFTLLQTLPADLNGVLNHKDLFFSRLYYNQVPRTIFWQIVSVMLLRERTLMEGDVTKRYTPTEGVVKRATPAETTPLNQGAGLSTPSEEDDTKFEVTIPEEFTTPLAKKIFAKLQKKGYLDEDLQPKGISMTQAAIMAWEIGDYMSLKNIWVLVGELWKANGETLRTYRSKGYNSKSNQIFVKEIKALIYSVPKR